MHFIQITYQAIISSDGRASFATFVYDEEGINEISANSLSVKVVGFDAGDRVESATVLSPGFSSVPILEHLNTFRIDGILLFPFNLL